MTYSLTLSLIAISELVYSLTVFSICSYWAVFYTRRLSTAYITQLSHSPEVSSLASFAYTDMLLIYKVAA